MTVPAAERLFTAVDHVGVAVPDLEAAVAYYRDVLGLREVHREVNEEQGVAEVMMAVGDGGESAEAPGTRIQLLAPLDENSTIAKFIGRSGPGLQQIAYRVDDLDEVCATLRRRGARLLYDEPKRGTANSRVNFIHPKSAGGVLVELVEPEGPAGRH